MKSNRNAWINETKPLTICKSPSESGITDVKAEGNSAKGGKTLARYCTDFHIWSVIDEPVGFSDPNSCYKNKSPSH